MKNKILSNFAAAVLMVIVTLAFTNKSHPFLGDCAMFVIAIICLNISWRRQARRDAARASARPPMRVARKSPGSSTLPI